MRNPYAFVVVEELDVDDDDVVDVVDVVDEEVEVVLDVDDVELVVEVVEDVVDVVEVVEVVEDVVDDVDVVDEDDVVTSGLYVSNMKSWPATSVHDEPLFVENHRFPFAYPPLGSSSRQRILFDELPSGARTIIAYVVPLVTE